jgi:hypothetical protein
VVRNYLERKQERFVGLCTKEEGREEPPGEKAGEVGWPLHQEERGQELPGEMQERWVGLWTTGKVVENYLERMQERFCLWITGKVVENYLESMQERWVGLWTRGKVVENYSTWKGSRRGLASGLQGR